MQMVQVAQVFEGSRPASGCSLLPRPPPWSAEACGFPPLKFGSLVGEGRPLLSCWAPSGAAWGGRGGPGRRGVWAAAQWGQAEARKSGWPCPHTLAGSVGFIRGPLPTLKTVVSQRPSET